MSNIIQGLWIGQSLSTMESLSINSFIAQGHEYHLYVYNEVIGAPPYAVLKDANEILPSAMIFQYSKYKSYAGYSNHFRYKLLLERGGWWADLDVICLKPLEISQEYVFASQANGSGGEEVTTCVMKAPRGAEILNEACGICESKDPEKLEWGETGPDLMQELVPMFTLSEYVKNAATFCPISPGRFYDALLPGRCADFGGITYTVHLWNELWRRLEIDKDEVYAPKCLYERLKNIYLPNHE